MNSSRDKEELVEELCYLMMKDKTIDENLKFNLKRLEVFVINMFVRKEKRNELLNVIDMNIKLDNLEEDLNNWETEILNKGKIEGKEETLKEIAKKLKNRISDEEISQITGLSIEKINSL